jgi:hypothetical protein
MTYLNRRPKNTEKDQVKFLGGDEFYSFFARKKIEEIERAGRVIVSQRNG